MGFRDGTFWLSSKRTGELPRIAHEHVLWALGSLCALHHKSFSADLLAREFPCEPDRLASISALVHGGQSLGFKVKQAVVDAARIARLPLPLLVGIRPASSAQVGPDLIEMAIVSSAAAGRFVLFRVGVPGQAPQPQTLQAVDLDALLSGHAWLCHPEVEAASDADAASAAAQSAKAFGFSWFVPELLRHRKVWRDVLLASLGLQITALATPLFTQAIIDKVVVHRTESTLVAIGVAMAIFVLFSALMGWGRQYLLLHTGNRVDAVLGAAVWERLLMLPTRYFERRPTGVVAARLQAVESIREFISGAAVSLVLDLPFLVICLGVMLWYSLTLTAIAVGMLSLIVVASLVMAPVFQRQLNQQFLLGARNQAFVTEHIAGFETVKTLQMEPQLRQRYSGYLAALLSSAFKTKQTANTYNTFATSMEQAMILGILIAGAYLVMTPSPDGAVFTVGMLVAFQMFAGKLSAPVLRIAGLWTQFQQASLSVQRLGDLMNAPFERYSLLPQRQSAGQGRLDIEGLAFRYADDRPLLFSNLKLCVRPGQTIAVMGASGSGKSTLAKLLLGFCHPTQGSIKIDGIDICNLSANELRANFGVVPQETILFSGSILANLQAGNAAATFDQAVQAAKLAGIDDVVQQMPQGYQTEIGERGVGLSGGQKQRLAIARALLKRPKVLIFDEATSALDAGTAEAFARTVNQLKGKVTMLFITHALPKALRIDGVLTLGADGASFAARKTLGETTAAAL